MASTSPFRVLLLLSLGQGWTRPDAEAEAFNAPYPSCDSVVIADIREYWSQHGKPANIASAVQAAGTVVLRHSSAQFLDSIGGDTVQCASGFYPPGQSLSIYTFNMTDGSSISYKEDVYIDDCENTITAADGSSMAYIIWVDSEHGVFAYYMCSAEGEKGTPQGGIDVAKAKYGVAGLDAAECSALEVMKCVGLDVSVTYPDECFYL